MVAVRAIAAVAGGVLVHLTLGTIYTFGNMNPYLTSYLREMNVTQVTYGDSVWIFAGSSIGQGASMTLGGFLEHRIGSRFSILVGGWLASSGVVLTFFTIKHSFALTLLTYGLMFGLGVGIAYAIPMACAMRWLPRKKGLVNGMVVAGFGGGAFIFDYIQTGFINPENLKPNLHVDGENYFNQPSILDRVPYTFLLLGGLYALLQLIGVLLVSNPPEFSFHDKSYSETKEDSLEGSVNNKDESAGLLENEVYDTPTQDNSADNDTTVELARSSSESSDDTDIEEEYPTAITEIEDDSSGVELSPMEVLKQPNYYNLWLVFLLNGVAVTFISTLYKAYGQTFIQDDFFLALVGAFAAVFNASGRIIWGRLADKYSYRIAMMILCGTMAVLMFTLQFTKLAGRAMFFIWVCAIFFTFSGNFSLFPTATSRSFGQKNMVKNYGLVFTSQIVASPLGALLSSELKERLGWGGMFIFIGCISMICMVITFFFNIKRKGTRIDI